MTTADILVVHDLVIDFDHCANEPSPTVLKPGFHYPSWRPELTARVDGWPVSITRQHRPCWRARVSTSRVDGPSTHRCPWYAYSNAYCFIILQQSRTPVCILWILFNYDCLRTFLIVNWICFSVFTFTVFNSWIKFYMNMNEWMNMNMYWRINFHFTVCHKICEHTLDSFIRPSDKGHTCTL